MQRKPDTHRFLWVAGLVALWAVLFAPALSGAGLDHRVC